jgi:hypothetical protein
LTLRPSILDRQAAALNVAGLGQAAAKHRQSLRPDKGPREIEKPNHRERPLLRARRQQSPPATKTIFDDHLCDREGDHAAV